jgi:hypothetical protein
MQPCGLHTWTVLLHSTLQTLLKLPSRLSLSPRNSSLLTCEVITKRFATGPGLVEVFGICLLLTELIQENDLQGFLFSSTFTSDCTFWIYNHE